MQELHAQAADPTAGELISMRTRMRGFIFPNLPVSPREQLAFDNAVHFQIEHEREQKRALGMDLPDGLTEVTIGHFTAAFSESALSGKLTRRTICDAAYAELLTAGLLYRGLEGRCMPCP